MLEMGSSFSLYKNIWDWGCGSVDRVFTFCMVNKACV